MQRIIDVETLVPGRAGDRALLGRAGARDRGLADPPRARISRPRHAGAGKDVEIEIKTGMSFPQIATMLADRGVIAKPTWFRLYAMWEGDTTNVKTGKYTVKDDVTPAEVLKILVTGVKEVTAKATLPEGKNMLECFALIEAAHIASAAELEQLARDKDYLAAHAIIGDSVEG